MFIGVTNPVNNIPGTRIYKIRFPSFLKINSFSQSQCYKKLTSLLNFHRSYSFIIFSMSPLVISMDTFIKRFQPDKYDEWIKGIDIGSHPEDPHSVMTTAPLPIKQVNSVQNKSFFEYVPDVSIDHIKNNPNVPEYIKRIIYSLLLVYDKPGCEVQLKQKKTAKKSKH